MKGPYYVDSDNTTIIVTGPTLSVPRAFFSIPDAKQFAEYLNAAWLDGLNSADHHKPTT
jgi:hypothetical protein